MFNELEDDEQSEIDDRRTTPISGDMTGAGTLGTETIQIETPDASITSARELTFKPRFGRTADDGKPPCNVLP